MLNLVTAYRKESYQSLIGKRMQAPQSLPVRVKDLARKDIFSTDFLISSLPTKSFFELEWHSCCFLLSDIISFQLGAEREGFGGGDQCFSGGEQKAVGLLISNPREAYLTESRCLIRACWVELNETLSQCSFLRPEKSPIVVSGGICGAPYVWMICENKQNLLVSLNVSQISKDLMGKPANTRTQDVPCQWPPDSEQRLFINCCSRRRNAKLWGPSSQHWTVGGKEDTLALTKSVAS